MGKKQYRLVYQREGNSKRYRTFANLSTAEKWKKFFTSNEPWQAFGLDPDEAECCSGHDCGCGGITVRETFAKRLEGVPKLLSVEIQEREVAEWKPSGRGMG